MTGTWKKLLSLLLCITMMTGVFAALPMTAYADESPYSAHGFCGAENEGDVEWFAFNDNSMVFLGSGAIRNYTPYAGSHPSPWYGDDFRTISSTLFINKIAVEYGVTAIGDYCFSIADNYPYNFYIQLKNIDIADTVTSIGKYAFYNQKIQEVMLPPSVTNIGENAFKNCKSLKRINYFGNPDTLVWDTDGETDTEFYGRNMVCHILNTYTAAQVSEFNEKFAYKHLTFVADMDNPYEGSGDELSRNIALYYGAANSGIFGGAAPYIIVGTFDGKKKSVTYGSNGFASAVKIGSEYYILTDVTKGTLNLATINSGNGRVTGYTTEHPSLKLHITHRYLGSNTVKIIYRLENTGTETLNDLQVGGTGDIKIGADDFASIEPLNDTVDEQNKQIGFYMKSTKEFDQSGSDYATLGFIGQHVKDTRTEADASYPDATFFYGTVDANASGSATGTKNVTLLPERIFTEGSNGQNEGTYDGGAGHDSGMSYYWNVDELTPNETEEFAVLFSVYGTNNTEGSEKTMITDLSETFYTVSWENEGTALLKNPVKENDTAPAYSGTPVKPSTETKEYTFKGWYKKVGETVDKTTLYSTADDAVALPITADTTFVAQFNENDRQFFLKHSLSIDGDIGVNYYVDVERAGVQPSEINDGTKKIKIHFHWFDKESDFIIDREHAETQDFGGKTCFKAKCCVNAAEMTYDITATAYVSEKDDDTWTEWSEYADEHDIYSVREYGRTVLNRSSEFSVFYATNHPSGNDSYENLRELMIRTLDYGAKAQLAYDRKPKDLANNIFSTYDDVSYTMESRTAEQIGAHTGEKSAMKEAGAEVGLKYAGSSVLNLSNTSIRHYFTVDETVLDTEEEVTNAIGKILRDNPRFTYSPKDHGLYFEYAGIPAAKIDEQKVFRIGGKDYSFSVLNYSQMVLNSNLPQADKNLAIAIYWYNDAANTFFNDPIGGREVI